MNERCNCGKRIDYDFQCAHELVADRKFILEKYNDRWLNVHTYYELYMENSPTNIDFYTGMTDDDHLDITEVKNTNTINPYENDVECSRDTAHIIPVPICKQTRNKISYQDLVKKTL